MKKLLSILLIGALLSGGVGALAEQDGDMSRFSIPWIARPTVPPVEVPEIPEIKVPTVPTASPTKKPKIEVPEIPGVEDVEVDVPTATADSQVGVALQALGVTAWPALYDALSRGETVGNGSRGEAAKGLQQLLAAFGQAVEADGIVGPKTLAALNAVQAQFELPQTDGLDAAGLAALLPLLLEKH